MPAHEVSIRTAEVEDAAGIAEIHVTTWRAAYRGIVPDVYLDRLDVADRQRFWERLMAGYDGRLFVAASESKVIGFCHIITSRDAEAWKTAEIAAIYVDPQHWRKGAGRALILAARAFAQSLRYDAVTLWVLEANQAGRAFYERLRFATDGASMTERLDGASLSEVRYRYTF